MNLTLMEPQRRCVLESFRQGQFDGVEILGQTDEKEFFELGLRERLFQSLAGSMPTARQKHQVPQRLVLRANLSLWLHGHQAFLAWEQVGVVGRVVGRLGPGYCLQAPGPAERQDSAPGRRVGPKVMKKLILDRGDSWT